MVPETVQFLRNLLTKETLIVLAGSWAWPAAVDLESKFSEAGLTHVQLVDYRNFAHGRHFWLAKRGENTSVVALACPDTEVLVTRILSTLPAQINSFVLRTDLPDSAGAIDLICQGMFLVGLAAEQFETRLTRPGVPEFGRRLYKSGFEDYKSETLTDIWVARKIMAIGLNYNAIAKRTEQSLVKFLKDLTDTHFEALVTDYDGTIYDRSKLQRLPSTGVRRELNRLLEDGLILGVATGRGSSVLRALREFVPADLWKQVIVGRYGGAMISSLAEPEGQSSLAQDDVLTKIKEYLEETLGEIELHFDLNPHLLSIRPFKAVDLPKLRNLILERLDGRLHGCRVVESAHSIDILGVLASKLRVVDSVVERTRSKDPTTVLRLGDQGAWNGNDYDLLAGGLSLSVDRVSGDLSTCWNISSPGLRSSSAAVEYLKALKKRRQGFQFRITRPRFSPPYATGTKR